MLNINIYTRNEGSKVKFSKIFVGAKSVFLKSVGAAAPTAPTLTRPLEHRYGGLTTPSKNFKTPFFQKSKIPSN